MITGKNKEQFEEWLQNQDFEALARIGIFGHAEELGFMDLPFEMQIGVYLAYYDSLGIYIDVQTEYQYTREIWEDGTNPHYNPEDWYFDIHNNYKNIDNGGGFETRNKAYQEAFKKANEIINNQ